MNVRYSVSVFFGILTLAAAASPAQSADDRLEKIKDRGVLRACTVNYVPWNIKNPATNEWEGINIEIAQERRFISVRFNRSETNDLCQIFEYTSRSPRVLFCRHLVQFFFVLLEEKIQQDIFRNSD